MNKTPTELVGGADFEKRINIWNTVPGNSGRLKSEDMEIVPWEDKAFVVDFKSGIIGSEYRDEKKVLDTHTYRSVICGGFAPETYTDEPYIIPYICEETAPAVIVIPGGGYGYVTCDYGEYEGKTIALDLNSRGISAFVLHYRVNPCYYPLPQLDVQRAVRYIRANAAALGVDGRRIGLVGFSAGGFEIASFINQIRGKDMFPANYTPDEADRVDDSVFSAGLIYPVVDYSFNVPMLFCSFPATEVRDDEKRAELLELTDIKLHFSSADIPQFIAYGTRDSIVGPDGGRNYAEKAREMGTDVKILPVENGDHGFGRENYISEYLDWLEKHV